MAETQLGGGAAKSQQDVQTVIEKYESFIHEKLQPDLNHILEVRDKAYDRISTYLKLKAHIEAIRKNGLKELKTRVDLGSNFYAKALIPDTTYIYVNVGFGFHLQLTLDEADKFIDKKRESLERQALVEKYTEDANQIRAQIKM
ncbi:hypothetical protein EV182_006512, partial [Spiromyces aspiralis]